MDKYLKIEKQRKQTIKENDNLPLREDEDYTEFIMEVINIAIKVVQTSQHDSKQRANKEIYTEFC